MREPPQLVAARARLSQAESAWRSEEALAHLREGLALLEEVTQEPAAAHGKVAANLLATYAKRLCESVRALVDSDPRLPEPELEHVFRLLLAFDEVELELPDYVRPLKIEVARRLIELYYDGHPAAAKEAALQRLTGLARGEGTD